MSQELEVLDESLQPSIKAWASRARMRESAAAAHKSARAAWCSCAALGMLILIAIASTAIVFTRVELFKVDDSNDGAAPTNVAGRPVGTATLSMTTNLSHTMLPQNGPDFDYMQFKTVRLTTDKGAKIGLLVEGFVWFNSTDMDLLLSQGHTLQIMETAVQLVPTSDPFHTAENRRRMFVCGGFCIGVASTLLGGAIVEEYAHLRGFQ